MQIIGTNNCIDNVYKDAFNIDSGFPDLSVGQALVITNNDIDTLGDQIAVLSGYVEGNRPQSSSISIPNNTPTNVTSISLPAGDWDVWGNITFVASGICTELAYWANNASASVPDASHLGDLGLPAINQLGAPIPYVRFNLVSTTTIYLSCIAVFSTGTVMACGSIFARPRPT